MLSGFANLFGQCLCQKDCIECKYDMCSCPKWGYALSGTQLDDKKISAPHGKRNKNVFVKQLK